MRVITSVQMFGEEDIINNCSRTYSAICTSPAGQLLLIKKEEFLNIIMQDEFS